MTNKLFDIAGQFLTEGGIVEIKPLGEGFINDTYKITTENGQPDYLLQRKNKNVFPDVPAMMENIVAVTGHIKKKVSDPLRETLTVIRAFDGKPYYKDDEGEFWAVSLFIDNTLSYFTADTPELARQGGIGIGRFHKQLYDFTEPLSEVIRGFHDIRWRFSQWDEALRADRAGRVRELAEEISWVESRRERMMQFKMLIENGTIPRKVSHNDTKISNILFNADDRSVLCAIDLDTVMNSTVLFDVGDALRSYTNLAAEDEPDLGKVEMSPDMFKAWIEGYLSENSDTLSQAETDNLAFSGLYITYEQMLRFLMDYINGDTYYRIHYKEHNLVRTRSQHKLLQSMEEQYEKMCGIVNGLVRK